MIITGREAREDWVEIAMASTGIRAAISLPTGIRPPMRATTKPMTPPARHMIETTTT